MADNAFAIAQREAVLAAYAHGMGLEPSVFGRGELTLGERPTDSPWEYEAFVVSAPGGTALCVGPGQEATARAHWPKRHYEATHVPFLHSFVDAAAREGRVLTVSGPNISYALRSAPPPPDIANDLRFVRWTRDEMNAQMAGRRFENGVGEPGFAGREVRNRWAIAIVDASGEPLAVGGVFDTFGLDEIGVDVLRVRRGEQLGAAVVAAATREILQQGRTPLYGCAAANIRSQRTAMSTGYVPVFCDASVP
jgi:hypothetical protein